MVDKISVVSCRGGLNEEASDYDIDPGQVRRSSNYEQVAEGGYRKVGGSVRWGGSPNFPDLLRTSIIEVTKVYDDLEEDKTFVFRLTRVERTAVGSGTKYVTMLVITRKKSALLVVEKLSGTSQFSLGDNVNEGAPEEDNSPTGEIISINPVLTERESDSVTRLLTIYSESNAAQPAGTGAVEVIQQVDDRMVCGRRDGENILLQLSTDFGRTGFWQDAHEFPLNTSDPIQWDSCAYKFQGDDTETAYLASGTTDLIAYRNGFVPRTLEVPGVSIFPTNVAVFQNHLFLGFANGSVIHSDIGEPRLFSGVGGAAEFNVGSAVTGFQELPGKSLSIFSEDRINILTGTSVLDWEIQVHSDEVGAIAGSIQNLPVPIFAATRGVSTLDASDRYGDFANKTLSHNFNNTYQKTIRGSRLYSCVSRDLSQYRLINDQGIGLYMTFNSETMVGAMAKKKKTKVTAMGVMKDLSNGCFYGTQDGWVYRLDQGDKFSEKNMDAFLEFPYYSHKSPRQKKAFKATVLDMRGNPNVKLIVTSNNDKGRSFHENSRPVEIDVIKGESQQYRKDVLSQFDQYFQAVAYTVGTGVDQSLLINPISTAPHEIDSITTHYTFRGQRN